MIGPQILITRIGRQIVEKIVKRQRGPRRVHHVGIIPAPFYLRLNLFGFIVFISGIRIKAQAAGQPQPFIQRRHLFLITLGQVHAGRNQNRAFLRQTVEIKRQRGRQRLALTSFHLGNLSLLHDDGSQYLHVKRIHS